MWKNKNAFALLEKSECNCHKLRYSGEGKTFLIFPPTRVRKSYLPDFLKLVTFLFKT